MKLRKILAMLLVVCMVFGTMGTAVFAEETADYSDVIASVEAVELNGTGHTFAVQFNGKGQPVNSYVTANNSSPWIMNVFINSNQNLKLEYGNPDADGYVSVLVPSMESLTGGWFNLLSPYPMLGMEYGKPINTTANTPCGVLGYFWECLGFGNKVSQHYEDIFAGEQGLSCGVSLTPEFIAENDNFYAEISLVIYQLEGGEEKNHITLASYSFGEKPGDGEETPAKNVEVTDAEGNVTYYAGFTGFSDLDLADCVIKLLADVSDANLILNKTDKGTAIDTNVTLDLNGFTFSREGSSSGAISLTQGSQLTICDTSDEKNGKIISDTYAVWIMNGDLCVESGTIETTSTEDVAIYINAAEVKIDGGNIISAGDAISVGENFMESRGASTISISGGVITAGNCGIVEGSYSSTATALTISGGEINSTNECIDMEKGTASITGGTFSKDVSAYVADGFELVDNGDGKYGVDEIPETPAYVAEVNGVGYTDIQAAVENAQTGDEITLLANVNDAITVPAGVILNGNGFDVNGGITAEGDITFAGITKAYDFDVKYVGTTINIGKGASLQLTGTDRLVVGHGCTFNIEGTITDAKNADKASLTPSLIMPGASFTGAGVNFNVKNAYISVPSSYCSSSKSASGTFNFNIENSIWDVATNKLAFEAQSTAATVNFDLKDSVLTTAGHLVFGVDKGEIVIDNSNVNVGASRQLENRSTMTIKNGSVVNGAVATSSNAINPGTVIVENATYAVSGQFSGAAVGTGTLVIKKGANVSVGSIVDKANIVVDATDMAAGDIVAITANLSKFAGTVSVINNNNLDATIKDGKIVLVKKPVAKIGDVKYTSLEEAIKAAVDGDVITLVSDIELGGTISTTKSITFDGDNHKITPADDFVADGNSAALVFDLVNGTCTIKNLTFEGFSGLTRVVRVNKYDATIENCTFKNNIVDKYDSGVITSAYAELDVKNCTFDNNSSAFAIINIGYDVSAGTDVVANIDDNTFTENSAAIAVIYLASSANVTGNYFGENIHTGTNANAAAVLAGPYTGDTTKYTINVTQNAFENAMSKDGAALPAVYTEAWKKDTVFDISSNYWDGEKPVKGVAYNSNEGDPDVTLSDYYTTYEDGVLGGLETVASAVAKIGDVEYTSLQDAIDAAVDGDIITLLADTAGDVTVAADDNLVLDLNGFDIVGEMTGITNNGTLIINDSVGTGNVYTFDVSAQGRATIQNYGNITINGGWFGDSNNDTSDRNAINRGNAVKNYGTAVINGGYFTNVSNQYIGTDAYAYAINTLTSGTTIINNATVYGDINGLIYSDGTTIIKDGSYTLGRPNEENNLWYLAYGNVEIHGGTWTRAFKVPSWNTADPTFNGNVKASGGIFNVNIEAYVAQGYAAIKNLDGNYVVGKAPTATVNNEGMQTVPAGDYMVYGGGSTAEDMPLSFVMQFVADQSEEDMATSPYAEWYGDFVITFTGIEDGSFIADGCYLAGHYGSFGWVKVPVDGMKIEEGVRYPVMLGVGMGQKYDYICSSVQDFKCALYLTEDILKTNPNIQVNLELAVVDNSKGEDAAASALVSGENTYKVIDYNYTAEDFEIKKPAGKVAYRAYITDSSTREAVQVDLENVYAEESFVVKLFDAAGNLLTTTTLRAGGVEAESYTCNIVLWGSASGSWDTVISAEKLTVDNAPAIIEVWSDGVLVDTYENAMGDKLGEYKALDCVYKAAKIDNTYYATFEDAAAAIKTDGSDTTIKLLTDIDTTESTDFKYGTGNVIFTADEPVTVRQTVLGTDWAFTTGKDMKVIVDENVTFEIYDNASGMYLYYGPSLELKGAITGGQNWGTLYLYDGSHTVAETGKVNVGRTQIGYTELVVKGEIDTNYLLVEGSTLIADGATINASVIYDNNNGGQRWGESDFDIKNNSDVTTNQLTLSYADSVLVIDTTSTLTAGKIVGAGKIVIDASAFDGSDVEVITADMSGFTGAIEVINNDSADYKIENGKVYIVSKKVANVAEINGVGYETLQDAIDAAVDGDTVTVLTDIELSNTLTIPSDKVVILDLNGKTISGICNTGSGNLIHVKNGAKLTIKDNSTEQTGKITYAQGTSNVGWTIDVEGNLVLESGTIELTGSWSIGYAVDVRPNAWGSAYTEPTTFVMNGGNIISSDGAVRVASTSSENYSNIAASFTMNDGKIDAAWDGVFVQQSNATWDNLSFTMNGGTIESDLNPVRFYGPAATSYVSGEDCVDIALNGGTLTYTGTEEQTWMVENILRIGGGVTADEFLKSSTVTASETFAQNNAAEGYTWVEADSVYTLEKVKTELFKFAGQTVSFDSSLALNIYLASSNVMGEGYYAIVEHEKADGTIHETKIPDTDWGESGVYKAIRYTGVAAKEMADKLTITVYDANDTQVSVSQDTSLRTYALNKLNDIVSKNITEQWSWLPALTDMLNYGAAAQDMFKYNQDDYAYVGAEAFQEHASSSDIYTLDKEGCSSSGLASGATVTFEEMLKLNFYFKDVTDDMYATYSYTTHRGTKVEGRVNYDSFTTYTYNNVVYLGAPVPVAIADANALVTVTLFNGQDEVKGTATYKVNAYLETHINKPDAIYDALAKFAVSAKTAFAND